ncbi:MAG: hypothetical protein AAFQ89_16245 [Cyanobacteria bacterium J06626_18]
MSVYHGYQFAFTGPSQQGDLSSWHRDNATPSWFRAIPPERVGIDGHYDYYGLKKRVEVAIREHFGHQILADLAISQRGRVVILQGRIQSCDALHRLVTIAQQVEGTIRVEAIGVVVDAEAGALAAR